MHRKHAILLLSSYGIDYLNSFLKQFDNELSKKYFDFYIHIDNKTYEDIKNGEKILYNVSNIIFCQHLYNSKRFSPEMSKAEFALLRAAFINKQYDYYHLCSDSCYICHPIDVFLNFFDNTNDNFLNYFRSFYNEETQKYYYKGSQWWSFHNDLVKKIIPLEYKFNSEYVNDLYLQLQVCPMHSKGAIDEYSFQNLIIYEICNNDPQLIKENRINTTRLHYVIFTNGIAQTLTFKYISDINVFKESMFVRKIDYKNPDSYKALKFIKNQ